jgi:uncharacterized protein (UPF0147 family)
MPAKDIISAYEAAVVALRAIRNEVTKLAERRSRIAENLELLRRVAADRTVPEEDRVRVLNRAIQLIAPTRKAAAAAACLALLEEVLEGPKERPTGPSDDPTMVQMTVRFTPEVAEVIAAIAENEMLFHGGKPWTAEVVRELVDEAIAARVKLASQQS